MKKYYHYIMISDLNQDQENLVLHKSIIQIVDKSEVRISTYSEEND